MGCFRQIFESATALSGRFRGRLGVENGSMKPMDLRISMYFSLLGAIAELWMSGFGFLTSKEQILFGFLRANKQSWHQCRIRTTEDNTWEDTRCSQNTLVLAPSL